MSDALLQLIGANGQVEFSGAPWLQGQTRQIGISSLTSKVLCQRHNNALWRLDDNVLQLYEALLAIGVSQEQNGCGGRDELLLLANGHDIERWCIKVLCGLLFSGNLLVRGVSHVNRPPPYQWLKFLFGERAHLPHLGLHVVMPFEPPEPAARHLALRPLTIADGTPAGMAFQLMQFQLALAPDQPRAGLLERSVFRAPEIIVQTPVGRRLVAFSWEHPGDPHGISLIRRSGEEYEAWAAQRAAGAAPATESLASIPRTPAASR